MTADDKTPITGDPDLEHLLDLISMLPGPRQHPAFWAAVAAEGHAVADPSQGDVRYVFSKMADITLLLQAPTPRRIEHLCHYLLFFFSSGKPKLHELLNAVTDTESSWAQNDFGRWWAEDITRTAWKLYTRYQQYGDDQWKEKWHFERDWTEWLPDQTQG